MSGRRDHVRVEVLSAWDARVRVAREVLLQKERNSEYVVLSPTPGVIDDELVLEISSEAGAATSIVKVLESKLVIVDGAVWHELRLRKQERA